MEDNVLQDNLPETVEQESTGPSGNSMREYVPQEEAADNVVENLEDDVGQEEVEPQEDTQPDMVESQEETFTKSFDPNSLPEELKAAYKQMQSDYTRKTTEIADSRRLFEKYMPLIQQVAQNPQLLNQLQGQQAPVPTEKEPYPDDIDAFAQRLKEEAKKEAFEEFNKYYTQDKQELLAQQTFEKDVAQAEKLDPRLETDAVFAEEVSIRVVSDPEYRAGRKSLVQATKDAVARYDGFVSSRLAEEKKKFSDIARQKRSPRSVSSSSQTVQSADAKPINSMRDAVPTEFKD